MSTPAAEPTPQIPSLDLFSLKGKNAFVTGGSRGIGAAIAIALADAGASVCIAQRDTTNTDTADAIRDRGVRAEIISCDLDDMDAVKGVFQRALDVMDGRIDILVNCGGILKRKEALSVSEEEWDAVRAKLTLCICSNSQTAGDGYQPQSTILSLPSSRATHGSSTIRQNRQHRLHQ